MDLRAHSLTAML